MIEQTEELKVFSILDRKKISKIMDVLDESIVKDQFSSTKIKDLEELGFKHKQSRDILECFVNFYLGSQYHDEMKEIISQADVKEDMKQLIMETFEAVVEKADKTKIEIANKSESLAKFGHEHLYHFVVISEFRPLVANDTLQKMVMSIIIEGHAHNVDHTKATTINFQTDLTGFENLIQELNEQLKRIKMEVKILEEKLGDDVVIA